MTSFEQFCDKAKMRHDFSDQIQVRYPHPNGENFDTWVSGEEAMNRLDTKARERLIKSFSQKDLGQLREEGRKAIERGRESMRQAFRDRLSDIVSDNIGDNIFGDTLADNIRGVDSDEDEYDREKRLWRTRLEDDAFRAMILELAWINLEGTFPDEESDAKDDWI